MVLYSEASARRRCGELPRAEALARESLALRRRLLKPEHPDLPRTLQLLGEILLDRRRYPEAESLLLEALQRLPATGPARDQVTSALARVPRSGAVIGPASGAPR